MCVFIIAIPALLALKDKNWTRQAMIPITLSEDLGPLCRGSWLLEVDTGEANPAYRYCSLTVHPRTATAKPLVQAKGRDLLKHYCLDLLRFVEKEENRTLNQRRRTSTKRRLDMPAFTGQRCECGQLEPCPEHPVGSCAPDFPGQRCQCGQLEPCPDH